jgi:hypothetical protein
MAALSPRGSFKEVTYVPVSSGRNRGDSKKSQPVKATRKGGVSVVTCPCPIRPVAAPIGSGNQINANGNSRTRQATPTRRLKALETISNLDIGKLRIE